MTYSHPDFHQFQCPACLKVLSSKQNFKQHKYIHTGDRPYVCDQCGEGYRQSSQMTSHRRSHFLSARLIPICKVTLTQLTYLLTFSEDWTLNRTAGKIWKAPESDVVPNPLPDLVKPTEVKMNSEASERVSFYIAQS